MKRNFIPYNPKLKEKAKKLRNNSTLSEVLLWKLLKNRVLGYKFIRQKPLLNFIVDFYCKDLRLAIEIDGISHEYKDAKDEIRQKKLEESGVKFLRFDDEYVKENPEGVIKVIEDWIEDNLSEK